MKRDSQQTLVEMKRARGVTWLDRQMHKTEVPTMNKTSPTFVEAFASRKKVLSEIGINAGDGGSLSQKLLDKLEALDLKDAAQTMSGVSGKPYEPLGNSKRIEGIYRHSVKRASGKFAVIERARDFTLVPWRSVMERRLDKSLIGRVSAGGISWDVTGRQGPSR